MRTGTVRSAVIQLAVGLLAAPTLGAQTATELTEWPAVSEKIDQIVAEVDKPQTPGGVIAVIYRGEVVHLKGYGAANRELRVPWTPDTRYRIASITKSFVAYTLLLLEQRGQLRLTDPLQKFLPDFPAFDHQVTIHHLMTMTSGLWQDEQLLPLTDLRGRVSLDEMYALSRRQNRLNTTPGSTANYVDANYRLLARIIRVVTGKSFPEALEELVFEPLGMSSTLADPDFSRVFDRQATTYVENGEGSARVLSVPFPTSGDGSIITTMRDMTKWLRHLHTGGAAIFRRMIAPVEVTDGLPAPYRRGIYMIFHPSGRIGWGHAGATGTSYVIWPDHQLAVAHFSNNPEVPATQFSELVMDAVLEVKTDIASQTGSRDVPRFQRLTPRDVELLSGTFVEPESGYVIVSEPWEQDQSLFHYFLGSFVLLTRVAEGHYRSWQVYSEARIEVTTADCQGCDQPDLLVRHADWPAPKQFLRTGDLHTGSPSPAPRLADYTGHYYSKPLGVHYTVEQRDGELVLRIGTGVQAAQTFQLQPLGSDCFIARPPAAQSVNFFDFGFLSLRFSRGQKGTVDEMQVSINKVRDLTFERVQRIVDS